jgi:hypothetical protein
MLRYGCPVAANLLTSPVTYFSYLIARGTIWPAGHSVLRPSPHKESSSGRGVDIVANAETARGAPKKNRSKNKDSTALMRAASFNIYLTRGAKRLQPSPFVMRHKSGARHPSSLIILLHRIRVSELTGAIFLTNCGARNWFMTGQLVTLRNQTSALGIIRSGRAQPGDRHVWNDH